MSTTLAAVFMMALAFPAGAQTSAAAADDAAIRMLVQQHDAARNAGDWKAMGAGFTDDADQLTSAGAWWKGRAAIEKGVAQIMAASRRRPRSGSRTALTPYPWTDASRDRLT